MFCLMLGIEPGASCNKHSYHKVKPLAPNVLSVIHDQQFPL